MRNQPSAPAPETPKYATTAKTIVVLFFAGGGRIQAETPHTIEELNERLAVMPDSLVLLDNSNDDKFVKSDRIGFYRKDLIFYNVVELDLEALEKAKSLEKSGLIIPDNAGKLSLQ